MDEDESREEETVTWTRTRTGGLVAAGRWLVCLRPGRRRLLERDIAASPVALSREHRRRLCRGREMGNGN